MVIEIIGGIIAIVVISILLSGFKVVRPTEIGVVERLGRYKGAKDQGVSWIIPIIDSMIKVNTTERLLDHAPQEIITLDNLNASVAAQVYFKVKRTEESIKASLYNVDDYAYQIDNLARTTLRNVIGTLTLKDANSKRDKINQELQAILSKETKNWGIEIVRTELKEINPPSDVQETMNKVVKAENEKTAAVDFATATETQADGKKRAAIKEAEGLRQARILEAEGDKKSIVLRAEGEAEAIQKVNTAAMKYFKGNAKELKRLEVTQASLENNSKIIVPTGSTLVIGESGGIIPLKK